MTELDVVRAARDWIDADPDPETRAELESLLARDDRDALAAHMAAELDFGTAGLRGAVGAGPARMNRAVVIRAVRAYAEHLLVHVPDCRTMPVIVGYDARPSSRPLAEAAVSVLLAAGISVRFFDEPVPTPLVVYAARVLSASGALVLTASHNPREDNGLKVYGPNAAQLVSPADQDVARRRAGVGRACDIPVARFPAERIGALTATADPVPGTLLDRYIAELGALLPPPRASAAIPIAYTPLHGVGWKFVQRVLASRGYRNVAVVAEQADPDGGFPTAPSPNPELPGVMDRVVRLAEKTGAALVLANDPDADRLAAAAPLASGRYLILTGNQIGALLADFVLQRAPHTPVPLLVTSIVSTPLLSAIGAHYGARLERTLTGFKWIWRAALALESSENVKFAFGCEEALGYSPTPLVRDKDGLSAALWLTELATECFERRESLVDRLHQLYRRHGAWASAQRSLFREGPFGPAAFRGALDRIIADAPELIDGESLTERVDYRTGHDERPPWLGAAELFEFRYGDSSRVLVRPSGTEPKLKIYADCREPVNEGESAETALRRASRRAESLAEAFATLLA